MNMITRDHEISIMRHSHSSNHQDTVSKISFLDFSIFVKHTSSAVWNGTVRQSVPAALEHINVVVIKAVEHYRFTKDRSK